MILAMYPLSEDVIIPKFATEGSACFDIRAYTETDILVPPTCRSLIPTGLIFDIPQGYSVRLHPRSGMAIKFGLTLINSEGVIDSDYVEPVFVPVINLSNDFVTIKNGDRICQGELVENVDCEIHIRSSRPERKTTRDGGFGSTGVS